MSPSSFLCTCLALVATAAFSAPLQACNLLNKEIKDALKPKVGVFEASGKFEREVDKTDVISKKITACNESLGLVQITLADGRNLWLDPIELTMLDMPVTNDVCVAKSSTKASDSKQAVSSGAGPTGKPCSAQ